jgi:hypothetical protein
VWTAAQDREPGTSWVMGLPGRFEGGRGEKSSANGGTARRREGNRWRVRGGNGEVSQIYRRTVEDQKRRGNRAGVPCPIGEH